MNLGPLPLLLVPMVVGVLAYLLRRWRSVPPLLATGVSFISALFLLLLPFGEPITVAGREILLEEPVIVLGRELVLGQADRLAMGFTFLAGAGLFLLAWRFDQGGLFAPMALGILGLLGAVLLIRPLVYAALFLQIAAALAVFPLHAQEASSARGGLRYLTFYTLALPGLLVSHWLLDMYAVSPDQVGLLQTATALIGLSFALMLGLFPFHAWLPSVGADGAPLMSAFIYTAISSSVWFLLLSYLETYPWLSQHQEWNTLLSIVGAITAAVGGLLGTTSRSAGTLMGYAVMVDTGVAVAALGQGTRTGIGLAVGLFFARALGLGLMAGGLEGLHDRAEENHLPEGLGREAPWSTMALFVGGLSLAGFPPTVGFAARWAALSTVLSTNPGIGLTLLLASTGTLVGLLRLLARLLKPPTRFPFSSGGELQEEEGQEDEKETSTQTNPLVDRILLTSFALWTLILGLFPSPIAAMADRLSSFFTFFGW